MQKMLLFFVMIGICFLMGCSHVVGLTHHFPIDSKSEDAEIYIFRTAKFIADGTVATIHLDEKPIAHLEPNKYIKFYVTPAKHILGVNPESSGTPNEIEKTFERSKKYYLKVEFEFWAFNIWSLKPISESDAEEMFTRGNFMVQMKDPARPKGLWPY